MDQRFKVISEFAPMGDQPQAIETVSYTHLDVYKRQRQSC